MFKSYRNSSCLLLNGLLEYAPFVEIKSQVNLKI